MKEREAKENLKDSLIDKRFIEPEEEYERGWNAALDACTPIVATLRKENEELVKIATDYKTDEKKLIGTMAKTIDKLEKENSELKQELAELKERVK